MKKRVEIMGILNLTPDSFSDGGKFLEEKVALKRIEEMIESGADIIDIGAESTGPNSIFVSEEEEMRRLKNVIDFIYAKKLYKKCSFSIDTYKANIARYALEHGFKVVNDVTALRADKNMLKVLMEYKPQVVLMYSKDSSPRTTIKKVNYDDIIDSIHQFLMERVDFLLKAGFSKENIIIDPGMGAFLSSIPDYSFEVIDRLREFESFHCPILIGISRKSCLGGVLSERDPKSIEWSLKAIQNGASIIRIHNVEMMKQALGN